MAPGEGVTPTEAAGSEAQISSCGKPDTDFQKDDGIKLRATKRTKGQHGRWRVTADPPTALGDGHPSSCLLLAAFSGQRTRRESPAEAPNNRDGTPPPLSGVRVSGTPLRTPAVGLIDGPRDGAGEPTLPTEADVKLVDRGWRNGRQNDGEAVLVRCHVAGQRSVCSVGRCLGKPAQYPGVQRNCGVRGYLVMPGLSRYGVPSRRTSRRSRGAKRQPGLAGEGDQDPMGGRYGRQGVFPLSVAGCLKQRNRGNVEATDDPTEYGVRIRDGWAPQRALITLL